GDNYYFRSLLILGPGRAAMLASLAPVFTALAGIPVLGERLGPLAILGIGLTLAGLYWTLAERERAEHEEVHGTAAAGAPGRRRRASRRAWSAHSGRRQGSSSRSWRSGRVSIRSRRPWSGWPRRRWASGSSRRRVERWVAPSRRCGTAPRRSR